MKDPIHQSSYILFQFQSHHYVMSSYVYLYVLFLVSIPKNTNQKKDAEAHACIHKFRFRGRERQMTEGTRDLKIEHSTDEDAESRRQETLIFTNSTYVNIRIRPFFNSTHSTKIQPLYLHPII